MMLRCRGARSHIGQRSSATSHSPSYLHALIMESQAVVLRGMVLAAHYAKRLSAPCHSPFSPQAMFSAWKP